MSVLLRLHKRTITRYVLSSVVLKTAQVLQVSNNEKSGVSVLRSCFLCGLTDGGLPGRFCVRPRLAGRPAASQGNSRKGQEHCHSPPGSCGRSPDTTPRRHGVLNVASWNPTAIPTLSYSRPSVLCFQQTFYPPAILSQHALPSCKHCF